MHDAPGPPRDRASEGVAWGAAGRARARAGCIGGGRVRPM